MPNKTKQITKTRSQVKTN